MAGFDDDDDVFGDDDLDGLPHDALAELENNAIQFTQAHTQAVRSKVIAPSSDYGDDFDDADFDEDMVIDESRSTPAIIAPLRRNIPGPATQQEQFRQQRYGNEYNPTTKQPQLASRPRPTPPTYNGHTQRRQPVPVPLYDSVTAEQGSQPSASSDAKVESLQRQLEELIQERNSLKNELNAKTGEISIVRSKQEKTTKEHEREVARLRKLNDENLAKQQKALDLARTNEKSAVTERDFIKRDLAESERARRLAKAKDTETRGGEVTTPKKNKPKAYRDGFDDDEIEIFSPSKLSPSGFSKRNAGSPSKGSKRKRNAVESPAGALQVIQPEAPIASDNKSSLLDEAILAKLDIQDDRYDFIGTMLDHRIDAKHLRTIEELGKYALPSSPSESLQSRILGAVPRLGLGKQSKQLSIDFCNLLSSIWQDCMDARYFCPVPLLVDILTFAVEQHTSSIAPFILDSLIPVAATTIDLVASPRFSCNEPPAGIDTTPCVQLLYLVALGCMHEEEHIVRFWKRLGWSIVLVMVSANQVEEDYLTMIKLLSTSIMKDTFGAISQPDDPNEIQINTYLDRLLLWIVAVPFYPNTDTPFSSEQHFRLRFQLLQLLTSITRSPFASKAFAEHPHAIGRIVALMSDQLDELYDYKPGREGSARLISLSMRLIYHFVKTYENIDMTQKLANIHGGPQKYLLCLSRLNFIEPDLLLESGIDADIPAYALDLLELRVTPEEGDAIHSAFNVG